MLLKKFVFSIDNFFQRRETIKKENFQTGLVQAQAPKGLRSYYFTARHSGRVQEFISGTVNDSKMTLWKSPHLSRLPVVEWDSDELLCLARGELGRKCHVDLFPYLCNCLPGTTWPPRYCYERRYY